MPHFRSQCPCPCPCLCPLSGVKRLHTCPPAAGWFTFGREAPLYIPPAAVLLFLGVKRHTHRLQAGLLSGAKCPFLCHRAAGRFIFGRETYVYGLLSGVKHSYTYHWQQDGYFLARSARVHARLYTLTSLALFKQVTVGGITYMF